MVQIAIPNRVSEEHRREQRNVGRFGLYRHQRLAVDDDLAEDLLDDRLPLLVRGVVPYGSGSVE